MKDIFGFMRNSDMFSHIISLKYLPRWIVLVLDVLLCVLSYYASCLLSSQLINDIPDVRILNFYQRLFVLIVFQVFFFWLFHTYSGVLRYSGYVDAVKLLFAVISNVIIIGFVTFLFEKTNDNLLFFYSGLLLQMLLRIKYRIGICQSPNQRKL